MKKDTMWIPKYLSNWRDVLKSLKTEVKVPFIFKNGTQIFCFEDDYEQELFGTFYEIFIEEVYTKNNFYHPQPDHVIFDIGANIGLFALFCHQKNPNLKVHCFEPAPQTMSYLKKNIQVNNLSNTIQIYPYGIFDKSEKKLLREASNSGSRSFFYPRKTTFLAKNDEVDCISLKDALIITKEKKIDFLKIDCEGSELEILTGISQDLWPKISKIALESHDFIRPECSRKVLEILEKQGFSVEIETLNLRGVNLPNHSIIRAANLNQNG